jgi:tetratricopeptide (TPR) repeat protein
MRVTRIVAVLCAAALAAGLTACSKDADTQKRAYVASGDQQLAAKKYADAIVEYKNAIKQDNRFGEAHHKLAQAYMLVGDSAEALREFIVAADLLPADSAVQVDAARVLLLAGQFEEAVSRTEQALRANPKNVEALVIRASATAGLRDYEGAISTLDEAARLDPKQISVYINLASFEAVQGRFAEAESQFKHAVSVDPRSIVAHLALANYYWVSGRKVEAESAVKKALEIDPKDPTANRALAAIYRSTDRAAEAETPLRAMADGDDLEAQLVLADYYVAQKRPIEARRLLDELAKRTESFAAATSRLAGIAYNDGDTATAHRLLDSVLAKEPNNSQVIVLKGEWLLSEKKLDEALAQAQKAVKASPRFAPAHYLLGTALAARNDTTNALKAFNDVLAINPRAFLAQLALAEMNLSLGRLDVALDFAEQAVKTEPRSGAARFILAKALFANGALERAQTELQLVADAGPGFPAVQSLMGQIRMRRGDADPARRAFARALELDPKSIEALSGLVSLDLKARRPADARRRIEAQLLKVPNDARLLLLAGRTFAATNDLRLSEEALKKAIDVDPSLMEAYHVLGQIYVREKRLDEARQAYERRVQQKPDDVSALTMIAMIMQVQGQAKEAQQRFLNILTIDPRAAVAANNVAYGYAVEGVNLDQALSLAQTAKSVLPDDPDVNDTLGWVYYKRDLASMAVGPLQFSVNKNPTNPEYRYHLGMTLLKIGDPQKAKAELDLALKLNANFPGAAEARRAVAGIK